MRSNRLASHPLTRGLRRPCDRQAGSQHPRSCPSGMHGPGPGDAARISECLAGRGLRARSSSEGPQCGPQGQREKRLWSPSATSRQVLPVRRGPLRRTGSRSKPEQDTRRRPERSPLYQIVAGYLETLLCERSLGEQPVAGHVEDELRGSLRCGILSFAFARPRGIRPPPQLPLRHRNGRHPHTHRSRLRLLGVRRAALPATQSPVSVCGS